MRDLILLDEERLERINKVKSGEKQTGDDNSSEKDIENLNYAGKLRLTWDNYHLTYATYQQ